MTVIWESDYCKESGGANCFKIKHLLIYEDLDLQKFRQWAEIIWAARSQYKKTPAGIEPMAFSALKRKVGGVKPPESGILCVTLGELLKLEADIIQKKGASGKYAAAGYIFCVSNDFDKCWEGKDGHISIEIESINGTYQVWHCGGMTTSNRAVIAAW